VFIRDKRAISAFIKRIKMINITIFLDRKPIPNNAHANG
jgi:hypothetical protein